MNWVEIFPKIFLAGVFVIILGNLVLRYYLAYKEIVEVMRK